MAELISGTAASQHDRLSRRRKVQPRIARLLDSKRHTLQLKRDAACFRSAGALAKIGGWEIDVVTNQVFWSDEVWAMLEGTPHPIELDEAMSICPPSERPRVEALLSHACTNGDAVNFECEIIKFSGVGAWIRVVGEPEMVEGKCVALRGAMKDITSGKIAEREIIVARDAAQIAAAAKSAFLANMSHEIRTPLNGIVAGADMLSQRELDDGSRKLVDIISVAGASLGRLLSDILDLARVEAGQVTLETSAFHLGELIRSTAALAQLCATEKRLTVLVNLTPEVDAVVAGDPVRTRQVLLNLLNNAVKFTDIGQVAVEVERSPDGSVLIRVKDTGIGFDPAFGSKLFGRFEQADSSNTRRFGGAGVGLSISCQLVQLMGGRIGAESVLGQGSTFWMTLPLPEAQLEVFHATGTAFEDPDRPLRILLADDHPTNRMIVELLLAGVAEITAVENGAQAVETFASRPFDLVLMDVQMPLMDGLTAVRTIRTRERDAQADATPIVMLTANALPEHVDASLAAGADAHLVKPVTLASLLGAIETALSPHWEGPLDRSAGHEREV